MFTESQPIHLVMFEFLQYILGICVQQRKRFRLFHLYRKNTLHDSIPPDLDIICTSYYRILECECKQMIVLDTAVYYLFDRDPESNTDKQFIEDMLRRLESSRDTNPDWGQPGLLLLSYPCIEAFTGMNLLQGSIGYCWTNGVVTGSDLKASLQQDGLIQNNITEETLLHCMQELFASMEMIGIDTDKETFMASVDHFGENNLTIYSWEENQYAARGQYGLLSLMILALLDLGLITITHDE